MHATCSYALFGCSPSAGGYIGGCNAWAGEGNSECAKQHTSAACEAKECYWVTRGGKAQCLSTGGLDANAQDGPAVRNEIQRRVMQSTRLKIPASFYGETTHCGGARGTTVFPMPCSQGSTWNTTLVSAIAAANALELRSAGGDQALSPILQVATDPRFGRLEGAYTVTATQARRCLSNRWLVLQKISPKTRTLSQHTVSRQSKACRETTAASVRLLTSQTRRVMWRVRCVPHTADVATCSQLFGHHVLVCGFVDHGCRRSILRCMGRVAAMGLRHLAAESPSALCLRSTCDHGGT